MSKGKESINKIIKDGIEEYEFEEWDRIEAASVEQMMAECYPDYNDCEEDEYPEIEELIKNMSADVIDDMMELLRQRLLMKYGYDNKKAGLVINVTSNEKLLKTLIKLVLKL